MLPGSASSPFQGTAGSYVALAAVSTITLSLLASLWSVGGDVSATIALLGLCAVYIASQELLVLFLVFMPASILVDLLRGIGGPKTLSGRGWLMMLQLLGMAAKAAGTWFAYQLWQSVSSMPSEQQQQQHYSSSSFAARPPPPPMPPTVPIPGSGGGQQFTRVQDPFSEAAYVPPAATLPSPNASSVGVPAAQAAAREPVQQPQRQFAPAASAGPNFDLV